MRMNVNLYLPDDVGTRAKEADLPLSRLLRDAVTHELTRRDAMSETLADPQTHEVTIEDSEGLRYTGRITGTSIAQEHDKAEVFLTTDERVIVYDIERLEYHVIDDPEETLRHWLSPGQYATAMDALGITPVIDL